MGWSNCLASIPPFPTFNFYLICPALFNYFNPFILQCLALFFTSFSSARSFFITHIFLLILWLPRVGNWDGFRAIWPAHYWISCKSYEWSSLTWIKILLFLIWSITALINCHIDLDKSNYLKSIVYLSFVHDCVEYVIVIRSVIFKSNHDPQKFFKCSKLYFKRSWIELKSLKWILG